MTWQDYLLIVTAIASLVSSVSTYTNTFLVQKPWFKIFLNDREKDNKC